MTIRILKNTWKLYENAWCYVMLEAILEAIYVMLEAIIFVYWKEH